MKLTSILTILLLALISQSLISQTDKHRLIVLADMGNEPDEEQQMLHLLMYANEIEIEGLIAVTGAALNPYHPDVSKRVTQPELFHHLIDGYEKVFENLKIHAEGWLSPEYLRSIVFRGQPAYGMDGVGIGKASEGSKFIISEVTKNDPRPVFVVVNAGSNTLAQALFDYRRTHTPEETMEFVKKLRVYENAAQDNAGGWINHEFPEIHWIRGIHQTKCYGGPLVNELGPHNWKPYPYTPKGQDDWAKEHIREGHGPLGKLYPIRAFNEHTAESPSFIEGGGTIPWLMLTRAGHTDPSETSWGSWSGRYSIDKIKNVRARWGAIQKLEEQFLPWEVYTDTKGKWTDPVSGIEYNDIHTPVWSWRQAMWNDFQARMDWCVKNYENANHHPHAVINNDESNAIIYRTVKPGETLKFDASLSSDPDQDELRYYWWIYGEAGKNPYGQDIPIEKNNSDMIKLKVPRDASNKEIHLILEVWDKSEIVPLVDYRRVILNVQ
ncbi:nucleoside hydrolase-like domain-containing protein [Maribacter sp. MAR_2009_72]|uniref:nucleoside hydrolase-like domain-containing protein n=1 Tax=Maribacter sp. MAR_2009_72 TaxID=1250050 RepID=UPI00119A63AA|nr:nucleoside hydrolase-like domain-containing protein [Maribacter sp. MAR_2009_72]TVZ14925.1 uncharacterized protein DUF1593 [Maribacter sp. MAR_2009_72]